MIKIILPLLILFFSTLKAQEIPNNLEVTIKKIVKNEGVVSKGRLKEGVTGIVIREFDNDHKAIIAIAKVIKSDENESYLEFSPFKDLMHKKLPSINTKPRAKDKVILGYLYDRVLPIVPNSASFKKLKENFINLTFIHPDLLAVELASKREPLPKKESFQKICSKLHIGLVLFMYKDGSSFVDCKSWKRVGWSEVAAADGELVAPFFNRFGEIEPPFYDFSDYKLKDFDKFYKKVEGE